ncbi:MFS transporter [Raineyella sp.]|uniref:Multidrug resistance protein Stp n=1 Tax=bioreactor metagenome TaxID=1076179 RepID=A0A644ZWB1_9ZZZZ|nr:MFS transporter [Raineyella sp.]MEA5153774.1 MFS transporter [Raineyella sp.]
MSDTAAPTPGSTPTDPGSATAVTSPPGDFTGAPRRWWGMAAIALGTSLVIMDATIANVALPVVIEDLHMTATEAQWVSAVYSLVFASLMLTSGRFGDLFGRRMMFIAGLVVFMGSSLAAGSATGPMMLLIARLVQGIGAAMVLPATTSTINAMFTGKERSIAFAIYGSAIGGMAAVGPLVGGWLATDASWRWAFWLNIPFGIVAVVLASLFLTETRDRTLRRGIDWSGTVLATVGLGGIVFALVESSSYGWLHQSDGSLSPVPFALAAGVALLGLWVWAEHVRHQRGAIVQSHLGLWRIRNFRQGTIASMIIALGEFGMLFTLPLVLQGALGYNALGTGWLMMVLAIGTFLMSGAVPQLTRRLGARRVVQLGVLVEAAAVIGLALALPGNAWTLGICLFVYGLGVGMATAQVTNVSLAEVPVGLSGEASGLLTTVRQIGSALGVAVLGGLLISSLTQGTQTRLDSTQLPETARSKVVTIVHDSIGAAIPGLRADPRTAPVAQLAADALVDAARISTGVAGGILLVGFVATLALTEVSPEETARRRAVTESTVES